jgi:long-chain acyl-CoA synthetase
MGRKAEIIKTTTGRRISPAAVEGAYRRSRYVDQFVVVGNDRPYLTALVSLNTSAVDAALAASGVVPGDADRAMASVVTALVEKDLAVHGADLARHEQIRAFRILPSPLSIDAGELTPTLKLRRATIEARHADAIDSMYEDQAVPVPALARVHAFAR